MLTRLFTCTSLALIVAGFLIAESKPGIQTPTETLTGVLIDKDASYDAVPRVVSGPRLAGGIVVAYTYSRSQALTQEAQDAGYGVFTYDDQAFVPFDAESNRMALKFFRTTEKDSDFRVEVKGHRIKDGENNLFHASKIELLK